VVSCDVDFEYKVEPTVDVFLTVSVSVINDGDDDNVEYTLEFDISSSVLSIFVLVVVALKIFIVVSPVGTDCDYDSKVCTVELEIF
jgi:hypothetical protein